MVRRQPHRADDERVERGRATGTIRPAPRCNLSDRPGRRAGATTLPQQGRFLVRITTIWKTTIRYTVISSIDVPEYFNFGFDVIDAWAHKDRNKLAMIWVNQEGVEKKFTFWDLMRLSNQIVNMLIKYGVNKGDRVLIMLPRVPEWWTFTIALIKRGAVYCPAPPCSRKKT